MKEYKPAYLNKGLQVVRENGLQKVKDIVNERMPPKEWLSEPEMRDELHRPMMLLVLCEKPRGDAQ